MDPNSGCVDPIANCTGVIEWIGDGDCNLENNNEQCDYDQGEMHLWCTGCTLDIK